MTLNRDDIKTIIMKMLKTNEMKDFLRTYNFGTTLLLSLATLAVVTLVIFHIVKLAKSGDNAMERTAAINGLLVCSICLIVLFGIDTVYAIIISLIVG